MWKTVCDFEKHNFSFLILFLVSSPGIEEASTVVYIFGVGSTSVGMLAAPGPTTLAQAVQLGYVPPHPPLNKPILKIKADVSKRNPVDPIQHKHSSHYYLLLQPVANGGDGAAPRPFRPFPIAGGNGTYPFSALVSCCFYPSFQPNNRLTIYLFHPFFRSTILHILLYICLSFLNIVHV